MMTGDRDAAVRAAARLLHRRLGIEVPEHRMSVLSSELDHLGGPDGPGAALERLLAGEEAPWDALIDVMTIPETYFFRQFAHFTLLREVAIARHRDGRPCRVLSAGCSSGEEAWSAAAVLASITAHPRDAVVGWDVSERRLRAARRGRYGAWSLRAGLRGHERFFVSADEGQEEVAPALRPLVSFARVNLVGPLPSRERSFDVVMLRNVGIYWSEEVAQGALLALAELVASDGLFMLGPSDPGLPRSSPWEHVIEQGARYYRRAALPAVVAPPRVPANAPSRPAGARPAALQPRERPKRATRPVPARDVFDDVRALADVGRTADALALLDGVSAPSARARLWRGILLLDLQRADEAVRVLRQGVFLEPREATFRQWLAHAYEAAGLAAEAARERRNAQELMAG